ncbi:hypothetical protein AB0A77_25225 [Streptomyces varsoviensis]|uniref:hypothetical protein n=1 Tax=Streptomyces varsoviensis TaxID=67373 RepID=UPI0033D9FAF4
MKITVKAAVPAAALILAAGAGTTYYLSNGNSAQNPADRVSAHSPSVEAQAARAYVGKPEDPATWRLPIEAYMPSRQQAHLVANTRDDLISQCMDKAGYPSWKPAPDLPEIGGKTLTDWRYGIHDAALASTRGYHPAADEQKAYDEAMEIGAVDKSGVPKEAVRACAEKADGDVPVVQPADIVQQISGDAFIESQKDPKVVAAFAQWSACMKSSGYSYKEPLDASDDLRFSDPHKVLKLEVETAEADLTCRDKYDVTRVWFDAESAIQRAKIADHLKEVNDAAKATKVAVAKAKST